MVNVSINLSPNRQCRSCRFNARSPYLVCAVHPTGPKQRHCPDFESLMPASERSSHGNSAKPPAMEAEWMMFWGPTENEWLAFWDQDDIHDLTPPG
ncbi:DUF6464 family protein [Nodosilinea sp. LEGE 07298]|uniref:DUF6464 family protein n=1 Tax=Nodosilinea sp. LEGE 07298 TaxID=2777970 RepID=UPI001D14644B